MDADHEHKLVPLMLMSGPNQMRLRLYCEVCGVVQSDERSKL